MGKGGIIYIYNFRCFGSFRFCFGRRGASLIVRKDRNWSKLQIKGEECSHCQEVRALHLRTSWRLSVSQPHPSCSCRWQAREGEISRRMGVWFWFHWRPWSSRQHSQSHAPLGHYRSQQARLAGLQVASSAGWKIFKEPFQRWCPSPSSFPMATHIIRPRSPILASFGSLIVPSLQEKAIGFHGEPGAGKPLLHALLWWLSPDSGSRRPTRHRKLNHHFVSSVANVAPSSGRTSSMMALFVNSSSKRSRPSPM